MVGKICANVMSDSQLKVPSLPKNVAEQTYCINFSSIHDSITAKRELVELEKYRESVFEFRKDECSDAITDSEFLQMCSKPKAASEPLSENQQTPNPKWKKSFVPLSTTEKSDQTALMHPNGIKEQARTRLDRNPNSSESISAGATSPCDKAPSGEATGSELKRVEHRSHRQNSKRARYQKGRCQRDLPRVPCRYCQTFHWSNGMSSLRAEKDEINKEGPRRTRCPPSPRR